MLRPLTGQQHLIAAVTVRMLFQCTDQYWLRRIRHVSAKIHVQNSGNKQHTSAQNAHQPLCRTPHESDFLSSFLMIHRHRCLLSCNRSLPYTFSPDTLL